MRRACIINAAIGGWYPLGQKRLVRSLNFVGFPYDILTWLDWPNGTLSKECMYNVKIEAFQEAIKQGYTHILWLDSSIYALEDPKPIFDIMDVQGHYFFTNAYNCAQECSDKCLDYFGITRDAAEKMPCVASGCIGFYTENPTGKILLNQWIQSAIDGIFAGSRLHDNQSKDPRFLCYRQDQSCISAIIGRRGIPVPDPELCHYGNDKPGQLLAIKGIG